MTSTDLAPLRPTEADHATAAVLATAAGELLLSVRVGGLAGSELKDAGDRAAHEFLAAELARLYPDDGVLSEEGTDSAARLAKRRVWVVDPLDGTREFAEPPRTDWAVHVALVIDGAAVAGAVALPAMGQTLGTGHPPVLPAMTADRPRLLVSRTRPGREATLLAGHLDGELVAMGSAGAKAMAVVRGEGEIYVHSGGQYEWDSAAPVAVAASAGLHVSRIDGRPLVYNRADPWLPDLIVCRPEYADGVVEFCRNLP